MAFAAEDRRLKVGGLLFVVLGFSAFSWVMDQMERNWPPPVDRQWFWLLIALAGFNMFAVGLLAMTTGFGAARPWVDRRRRRALGLQLVFANLLVPLLFMGFWLDDERAGYRDELIALQFLVGALSYLLALAVWRLWRLSQRHAAPSADEVMAADPRAPVVYLRSFRDDGAVLEDAEHGRIARWWRRLLAVTTPEQECASALDSVGPVVAIGKPGEPLPELGAARLYVGHDDWQDEVKSLMTRAALVVLRIGSSPGLLWELEQALARVRRERLVLAIIGDSTIPDEVAARISVELGLTWNVAAPEPPPAASVVGRLLRLRPSERRIGALVCFPAGNLKVFEVRRAHRRGDGIWREPIKSMYRAYFPVKSAWQEVFSCLELQPSKGRAKSRTAAIALALLFGYVGVHWLYLGHRRRAGLYLLALPLGLSIVLSWFDAIRFVWVERAEFDQRFISTA